MTIKTISGSGQDLAANVYQFAKQLLGLKKTLKMAQKDADWANIIYLDSKGKLVRACVRMQNISFETDQFGRRQTTFEATSRTNETIKLSAAQVIEANTLDGSAIDYFGDYLRQLKQVKIA